MNSLLLVEDDHDTRVELRDVLEHEGFIVYSATNGIDALKILKQIGRPSVIVLDWMLPLMNGGEFLAQKAIQPELADIPVVVVSAVAKYIKANGTVSILPKPINLPTLLDELKQHCH